MMETTVIIKMIHAMSISCWVDSCIVVRFDENVEVSRDNLQFAVGFDGSLRS